jgi:hypothetical protein
MKLIQPVMFVALTPGLVQFVIGIKAKLNNHYQLNSRILSNN